ncbi:hypothetical protein M378DRAFT_159488, partial [Amanita muscaria Koide BX008]
TRNMCCVAYTAHFPGPSLLKLVLPDPSPPPAKPRVSPKYKPRSLYKSRSNIREHHRQPQLRSNLIQASRSDLKRVLPHVEARRPEV